MFETFNKNVIANWMLIARQCYVYAKTKTEQILHARAFKEIATKMDQNRNLNKQERQIE